jgi:hypothetical protein
MGEARQSDHRGLSNKATSRRGHGYESLSRVGPHVLLGTSVAGGIQASALVAEFARPIVIYSDASYGDVCVAGVIGSIIFWSCGRPESGFFDLKAEASDACPPHKKHIMLCEALPVMTIMKAYPEALASKDVIWLVDNEPLRLLSGRHRRQAWPG